MVVTFARKHGSLRRADVVELCRVTPKQASRLLVKLVAEGQLVMTGSRKTAVYAPAAVAKPHKKADPERS